MIHIHKSGEMNRLTKTFCKVLLEDLPRKDCAVEFRNRHLAECIDCLKVADKTESLLKIK